MTTVIHPTALVDSDATLDSNVVVGPYSIIGPKVTIEAGTTIASHAVVERNTRIGSDCYVGTGTVLGGQPQDRKFQQEETWLEIGNNTSIREYCTINRGTAARVTTSVGPNCFIMSYVHIAHDCVVENDVVISNMVQLAGHVHIEGHATVGGLTPVHQFVRIGTYAFIGGGSRLPQDVPPYTRAAGNPYKLYGINTIGLTRAGFDTDVKMALKQAYRLLFNSDLTPSQAINRLRHESGRIDEVMHLVEFVACSERGVLV